VRTLAINTIQPPAPTPDALELRRKMRVACQAGLVGRLEGVVIDTHMGLVTELLVRVRDDVDAEATWPTDPLWPLLEVRGQRMLLPPAWATKTDRVASSLPLLGSSARLVLSATAAQIARSLILRSDADLTAGVWSILSANPAIEPLLGQLHVSVRDGTVMMLGTVPTARHRLSAEQDVWHVPGVLAVHNELVAAG
jgi:hypothetical protein